MRLKVQLAILVTVVAVSLPLQAQDDAGVDRIREALRSTTAQLRSTQADLAVAKADKERLEEENSTLQRRLETLARQSAEDHAALQVNLADVREDLQLKTEEALRLASQLEEWQRSYDRAQEELEAVRQELAAGKRALGVGAMEAEALKSMNRELYRLGMEILERYENYSLSQSIAAREPFTRITRGRLKVLIQDLADELDSNRIRLNATVE